MSDIQAPQAPQSNAKKPHVVVMVEVFDYHHFNGRDPQKPRPSTRIKGVMTLPDGGRTSIEFFVDGHHHFMTPFWNFGIRVGADYKNNLRAEIIGWSENKTGKAGQ